MSDVSNEDVQVLRSVEAVRAADAVPHAQALATETGLRGDVLEDRLDSLVRQGLLQIEGAGRADRTAESTQPFYWLTDAGRRVIGDH